MRFGLGDEGRKKREEPRRRMRDAINAGTHCNPVYKGFGEAIVRLSDEKDVRDTRLHRAGIGYQIADRSNVDYTNIRRIIIKKETWGHLA